jgi:hypothetical protein
MFPPAGRSEFDFDLEFLERVLIFGGAGELCLETSPLSDGLF